MSDSKSQLKQPITLLVIAIGSALILFFVTDVGRAFFELRTPGWHEWADFKVPADALPLQADIKVQTGVVTVCNPGDMPWKHALIRITGGYLAEIRQLSPGNCQKFNLDDFRTNSWKRMPPPRDLVIASVEVLSDVTAKGYAKWPLAGAD